MDFDIKPKKVRATTMFEINDEGRQNEYDRHGKSVGSNYIKPFVEFLESLGFEIKSKYDDTPGLTDHIIIDGVEFGIDTTNASYKSYNIYDRKVNVRKPENRYVALERGYNRPVACRVHINKEIDAENLKARINKAIQEEKDRETAYLNREQLNKDNAVTIAVYFLKNKRIKEFTRQIGIERSKINFSFNDGSYLTIGADGKSLGTSFYIDKIETIAQMDDLVLNVSNRARKFRDIVNLICSIPPISKDLADWTKEQHHIYFNVAKMSID